MNTRLRSIILRYGLPAVSFAVIILITQALKRYFGFAFDPNLLLIGVFIASAWYGGTGPGLLVVLECELTIQYLSLPQSLSLKFFLLMLNRLVLLVSFVLFVSSRRKAQQRIEEERDRVEEERERLRVSLASIGDAVIATDTYGAVNFINPVAEALTGWTTDEARGRPLAEVFHIINEFSRKPVESPVEKVLREGTVVGLANHTLLITRDNREIPIDDSGAPIRLRGGEVVGVILVFRDVSERKKAEENKAALAAIVESSDDAIFSKDLDGIIRSWNRGAERLYYYKAEEVIGKPVSLLMPPDMADDFPSIMSKLRRGEHVERYETERVRKDGKVILISLTVSPIRDADGEIIGASAIARDITERKHLESERKVLLARERSARREAERRERDGIKLTEMSRELVAHLHTPEVTAIVCGAVRELLDCQGATFIVYEGESVFYADENAKLPLWKGHRFSTTNCVSGWSIINRTPVAIEDIYSDPRVPIDAYRKTFVKSLAMMPVGPGEPVAAIGAYWAEGHQASSYELDLLRAVATAADLALARAKAYDEMSAARARAEEANRLKDEFLATLSHELRTPLNAMMGWSRLIQDSKLDEATRRRGMEIIERNANAQTQLIEDILDVSRVITGRLTLNTEPLRFAASIEAAVDSARPAAAAKGIHLSVTLDQTDGVILGDATRLQQIVWNLLMNAIKFTPQGGSIWVTLSRQGKDARLTVRDTGRGVKAEFLPYVFDQFRQQESVYTRQQGGLGLGLALVKHLVELQGGSVEAYSDGENKGATFIVTLPLIDEAKYLPATIDKLSTNNGLPSLSRVRVLVVEDDLDSLELARYILEKQGAEVKSAARAKEAIEVVKTWVPQVLVSDIGLPDEDGYSLIRKVRDFEKERQLTIPAIALTGFAGEKDGHQAMAAGFHLFLTKPMEAEKLLEAIRSLVMPERAMKTTD